MSTATMNLTQSIAAAVLANPAAVSAMKSAAVLCQYCDKPLQGEDLAHLAEMGGEIMCSSCAEMAEPTATPAPKTALELEFEKLKAENMALKSASVAKTQHSAPAKPAASVAKTQHSVVLPDPSTFTKADTMLLKLIDKFKTAPDKIKPGVIPGTYAVKVHGYLHAAGIPEPTVRTAVESAINRNVISKMPIQVNGGAKTMMLYFDARVRPNFGMREQVSVAEKAAAKDAFGL